MFSIIIIYNLQSVLQNLFEIVLIYDHYTVVVPDRPRDSVTKMSVDNFKTRQTQIFFTAQYFVFSVHFI